MSPSLAARVAALETQVKTLQELPAQVAALDTRVASLELQILRFRADVKDEFLTTRRELTERIDGLRTEIGDKIDGKVDGLRTEIFNKIDGDGGLREEMGAIAAGLREEIQSGDAGLLKEIRAVEGRLHKGYKQEHEKTRQYIGILLEGRTSRGKNKRSRA